MFDSKILKSARILFVEDEEMVRTIVVETFINLVDSVEIATNGQEGLDKFLDSRKEENNENNFDLIITDINMPKMNGLEMIDNIRKTDPIIPIIIVSAHDDQNFLKSAIQLSVSGFSIKPMDIHELLTVMIRAYEPVYLRKNLEKKVDERTSQIMSILDMQDNIVILTDGEELNFANKKLFDFLGYSDLEEFKLHHKKLSECFIENDRFFHLGKLKEGENWLEVVSNLPSSEMVVSMMGKDFQLYAFTIKINDFDEENKIVSFADISSTMLENIELKDKTIHDKLTGARNREYFENNYKRFIEKYESENAFFGLAVLDIDHFKEVNDNYGHDVGDAVLIQFVQTVQKHSREEDILIRWGGEEFIMMLKVKSMNDLHKILESLRHSIERQDFHTVGTKTCSIGGTLYKDNEDIMVTIKRADETVYEAKNTGRNKVILKA